MTASFKCDDSTNHYIHEENNNLRVLSLLGGLHKHFDEQLTAGADLFCNAGRSEHHHHLRLQTSIVAAEKTSSTEKLTYCVAHIRTLGHTAANPSGAKRNGVRVAPDALGQ